MLLSIIATVILVNISYWLLCLFQNYRKALKIGLPVLIMPVSMMNPFWQLFNDQLTPLLTRLPFGLGNWATRNGVVGKLYNRFGEHAKHGRAFVDVSPAALNLTLADPQAVEEVLRQRNLYIKDPNLYGALDCYGPNLDTVNGKVWDRHRRITVPPFNERNSALVWQESLNQAEQMLQVWRSRSDVRTVQHDVHALALNVLCGAGFGQQSEFIEERSVNQTKNCDKKLGYRESLRLLISNIVVLVFYNMLSKAGLPDMLIWGKMKLIGGAFKEFKVYMQEIIEKEREAAAQGETSRHNLLSALIRADEQAKAEGALEKNEGAVKGLTDNEIYGNLFIYNLAGHDTTAGSIHAVLLLLGINEELQEWLAAEIDSVRRDVGKGHLVYEEIWPRLVRCLALMYETVRLYGPVIGMPRLSVSPSDLVIEGKSYNIPAGTMITVNFAALHADPESWSDPLNVNPSRWIEVDSAGKEQFKPEDKSGSFVAWSGGPRICPGKKFSQVEFAAVMFTLFADGSRVRLVAEKGESKESVRQRARQILLDARVITVLKLENTERIGLEFVKK